MRISDWSSDVCSSDLAEPPLIEAGCEGTPSMTKQDLDQLAIATIRTLSTDAVQQARSTGQVIGMKTFGASAPPQERSEERRVGKECVRTCRYRWSPYHEKKKANNMS